MSLMDDIEGLPDDVNPTTARAWHSKLQMDNPEQYADLLEVVEDWISGGVVREKFLSKTKLHKYLIGRDMDRLVDPPVVDPRVSLSAFKRFMAEIERKNTESKGN